MLGCVPHAVLCSRSQDAHGELGELRVLQASMAKLIERLFAGFVKKRPSFGLAQRASQKE